MTYIVQRRNLFYLVDYDGIDAISGKERRRWHPAGNHRADASTRSALVREVKPPALRRAGEAHDVGDFLTGTPASCSRPSERLGGPSPFRSS